MLGPENILYGSLELATHMAQGCPEEYELILPARLAQMLQCETPKLRR